MYLFQVKAPSESKGEWDYYKLIGTLPGRAGVRPARSGLPSGEVIGSPPPRGSGSRCREPRALPNGSHLADGNIGGGADCGQLLIGLINGAGYAMLSLGLAIIFGLLNIINVTHGAQYMMGAFCAWMLLTRRHRLLAGAVIAPVLIGLTGSCSNACS